MKKSYKKIQTAVFCMTAAVLLLGLTSSANAQQTVTGTVTDAESGETLPGVNVMVKGTTQGTATNVEGEYSLGVPGPESVLVFSFVGYRSQEITVGDQEVIDVSLELD